MRRSAHNCPTLAQETAGMSKVWPLKDGVWPAAGRNCVSAIVGWLDVGKILFWLVEHFFNFLDFIYFIFLALNMYILVLRTTVYI